ncbi:anti-sigma factor [Microbacterium sp. DT81.1]|uniref:anti-sigma factor n=1 Tax=Microbacterium sp. DT81.1 TaxID=3393413 RepID=UPI003CEC53DF
MSHLEPEQLALLAMGEPVASDAEADHLAECAVCADELALFRHTAIVGRSAIDAGELETPPDVVWSRISEELGLGAHVLVADRVDEQHEPERAPAPATASAPTADVAAVPAPARHAEPRRRSRLVWALAAALVVVAGVGVGSWALLQRNASTEIAQAELNPFPDHPDAVGAAVVEEERDGELLVRVTVDSAATPDTYREVWLINSDATALISLGVLDGTEGTFPIPSGVDLRDYVLVDVSQEPIDGDPQHSGDSIVRGELSFV